MTTHWAAAVGLGFLLGLRHALDPDHVVAMSTLVSRTRRLGASWFLGAAWGLGHTATVFAAGATILLLKLSVSPRVEAGLELAVGVMLVVLGVLNLKPPGTAGWGLHEHSHAHGHEGGHGHHPLAGAEGGAPHTHPHAHSPELEALAAGAAAVGPASGPGRPVSGPGRPASSPRLAARAFLIGSVHGLAGSGAIALLVMAAIPETGAALAYLAVFGLGTLAGMTALSAGMELALLWAARRWSVERWLAAGLGIVSLAFGLYIMYRNWTALAVGARPSSGFMARFSTVEPRRGARSAAYLKDTQATSNEAGRPSERTWGGRHFLAISLGRSRQAKSQPKTIARPGS